MKINICFGIDGNYGTDGNYIRIPNKLIARSVVDAVVYCTDEKRQDLLDMFSENLGYSYAGIQHAVISDLEFTLVLLMFDKVIQD